MPDVNNILNRLRKEIQSSNTKVEREPVEVVCSLQVAKEGSKYFYKNFAVMLYNKEYYVVSYNKDLPDYKNFKYNTGRGIFKIAKVDEGTKDTIVGAVSGYRELKGYNLSPYTSLVLSCLQNGLDLIKTGLIDH